MSGSIRVTWVLLQLTPGLDTLVSLEDIGNILSLCSEGPGGPSSVYSPAAVEALVHPSLLW